ncbi:hypothetical protein [Yoonia sp. BS5-3]|uniref:Uncharacterized protein n=1 Tax=Yoonia phaeophyticola TaxID=3137369 RepID=A0ABZ2V8N1_9RHOB
MARFSKEKLWAVLDQAGVPFRESERALVDRFGTRPTGWTTSLEYCELPGGEAIIASLAHPLVCGMRLRALASDPPSRILGYVRVHDDPAENQRLAISELSSHFGAPEETNDSGGLTATWGSGFCSITATVSLPQRMHELQNARHDAIAGSQTECRITIRPDWWPPLDAPRLSALQNWVPDPALPIPKAHPPDFDKITRAFDDLAFTPPMGQGLTADGAAYIWVNELGRGVVVPRDQIIRVFHMKVSAFTERGIAYPGYQNAEIIFLPDPERPKKSRGICVVAGSENDGNVGKVAAQMAAQLDVELG